MSQRITEALRERLGTASGTAVFPARSGENTTGTASGTSKRPGTAGNGFGNGGLSCPFRRTPKGGSVLGTPPLLYRLTPRPGRAGAGRRPTAKARLDTRKKEKTPTDEKSLASRHDRRHSLGVAGVVPGTNQPNEGPRTHAMCYHFSDSPEETQASDDAATSLEYTTTLTAPGGYTTPLAVKASPAVSGKGYRVVLTPDADADHPKTFEVRAARDHDDVQSFVDGLVASFARPYDPADPFDHLLYEAGLGSSSLSRVCLNWQARDLTDYASQAG